MKKTEQRWMRTVDGHMTERDCIPTPAFAVDYELVTVTWDEPEWEDMEVVRMYCPECQTVMTKKEHEQNNCCKNAVELRGTYRRRKPEPEAWEASIWSRDYIPHVSGRIEVISDDEDLHGKKVRVEVVE